MKSKLKAAITSGRPPIVPCATIDGVALAGLGLGFLQAVGVALAVAEFQRVGSLLGSSMRWYCRRRTAAPGAALRRRPHVVAAMRADAQVAPRARGGRSSARIGAHLSQRLSGTSPCATSAWILGRTKLVSQFMARRLSRWPVDRRARAMHAVGQLAHQVQHAPRPARRRGPCRPRRDWRRCARPAPSRPPRRRRPCATAAACCRRRGCRSRRRPAGRCGASAASPRARHSASAAERVPVMPAIET